MKLAAIFLVFKDQPFIAASFRAMYPIVDSICCVTSYDRNLTSRTLSPDQTIETLLAQPDPQNKLRLAVVREPHWLPGEEAEARLRNAAMQLAGDADYYLIIDADEVHTSESLGAAWAHVQKTQWAGYRMASITYFKSWNYCIEPNEGYAPLVFLRRGFHFQKQRQACWRGFARFREYLRKGRKPKVELLNPQWFYHHGAYVGDDARISTKIQNWSHSHEVVPDWIEEKWKKFGAASTNLHPVHPPIFQGVKHVPTAQLPEEVSAAPWPPGWIEKS